MSCRQSNCESCTWRLLWSLVWRLGASLLRHVLMRAWSGLNQVTFSLRGLDSPKAWTVTASTKRCIPADTETDVNRTGLDRPIHFIPLHYISPWVVDDNMKCILVTFVHCGQTVGRIKMTLGMQVGLGPGHNVLDGDPAPLRQRGAAPNFRPISVAAKWLHGSRCHLVRS